MNQIDINDGSQLLYYIKTDNTQDIENLFAQANETRQKHYQNKVYLRGLIEFSNYCKNNCYYCGIRKDNRNLTRYRLSLVQIMECCEIGANLGYKTFVLQSGEDAYYTDDKIIEIISSIRDKYPKHAITLSIGEKSKESYQAFFNAGANRYLLRHETANEKHYSLLHPANMTLSSRKQCLFDLKSIGYQVGAGLMVGSPFQTDENLFEDLKFLQELSPHMVGIGPFISQSDTPFAKYDNGDLTRTLKIIALTRLILPSALIPATTALGSISPQGRELALKAGANVVMPNLSPVSVREHYALYDNKICTGDEAAECNQCISKRISGAGFAADMSRGDWRK